MPEPPPSLLTPIRSPPASGRSRRASLSVLLWSTLSLIASAGCTEAALDERGGGIPTGLDIHTMLGPVVGELNDGTRVWRGLPYAATPTGTLRFRPPMPHPGWQDALLARTDGKPCPQADLVTGAWRNGASEDCLRLSIRSPSPAPSKYRPVLVWLDGTAFVHADAADPARDGAALVAKHNLLFVRVNYRLGALGFLYLPELAAADSAKQGFSANLGLQDQIAALQWIRDNIGQFGGNPDNVTLVGSSAGATSICALLTTPASEGLFQRVIMQSGQCHVRLPSEGLVQHRSGKLRDAVGCGGAANAAACLRTRTARQLVTALTTTPTLPGGLLFGALSQPLWGPFVDGDVLPVPPSHALATSTSHFVDVLLGTNRDEATAFHSGQLGELPVSSNQQLLHALGRRFGNKAHVIMKRYPPASFASHDAMLAKIGTDAFYTCPARRTAKALAAYTNVYRYHFEQQPTGVGRANLGVFHGAEIPYVIGRDGGPTSGSLRGPGKLLSAAMQRYWTRFAETSDPNGKEDPSWPLHGLEGHLLRLAHPAEADVGLQDALCDFWDKTPFHEEPPP